MNFRDTLWFVCAVMAASQPTFAAINGLDTWTPRVTAQQVVYGNGRFVAFDIAPSYPHTRSRVSSDGTNWTTWLFPAREGSLSYAGDRFFSSGSSATSKPVLLSSPDGMTWRLEAEGLQASSVAWDGINFVAVGTEVWTRGPFSGWQMTAYWTPQFSSPVSAAPYQAVLAAGYYGIWAGSGSSWQLVSELPVARPLQVASRYLAINPATTTTQTNEVYFAEHPLFWEKGYANISWSNCLVSSSLGLTFMIDPVITRRVVNTYGHVVEQSWAATNIYVTADGIYWEKHAFVTNQVSNPYGFQVAYNNGTVLATWDGQLYQSGFMDGYRLPPPVLTMTGTNRLTITGPVNRNYVIEKATGGYGAPFQPVYSYRHENLIHEWEDPDAVNAAFYRCLAHP